MIRPARREEAALLTRISFESKGYWGYPREYFQIWKDELTILPEYIETNDVYVFETGRTVLGYYSIIALPEPMDVSGITIAKGFWMEHMFVDPDYIGRGIGTRLFRHLRTQCKEAGITELGILADPNAKGFYEKMGCRYVEEYPSTIRDRTTPYLSLSFSCERASPRTANGTGLN